MLTKIFKSTSLKANIISNFLGNVWISLIGFIFMPIYLNYIGAEGYGLIGIFMSLQVMLKLFDSGLSTTINKELSRLIVIPNSEQKMQNVVKSLGLVYLGLSLVVGLIAISLSPLITKHWVTPVNLSTQTVTYAFMLLSLAMMFQFNSGFYKAGLLGMQRQVVLNSVNIVFATLKAVGAIIVLIYSHGSILAFFLWSVIISFFQLLVLKFFLNYYLPKAELKAKFNMSDINRVKKFATGMLGISISAMILSNLDKIILSKILTLEDFGYYSISCTLGFLIYQIIGPFTQSYFPKFSNLISLENIKDLKLVYHQACQLVSVLVIPATFILIFFSKELIFIWSGDVILSEKIWLLTAVFAFGTGINGLMNIPHMLTLAYDWTKLGFQVNIIIVVITIPLLYFLVLNFGSLGGALSWSIINILYFSFVPHIIHRKILKNELSKWYLKDNISPLFLAFAIVGSSKYIIFLSNLVEPVGLLTIILIGIITVVAQLLLFKDLRDSLTLTIKSKLNYE